MSRDDVQAAIKELQREQGQRVRVYKRLIEQGKLTEDKAQQQNNALASALLILHEKLATMPEPQLKLFN